jgi:hypothetical protein
MNKTAARSPAELVGPDDPNQPLPTVQAIVGRIAQPGDGITDGSARAYVNSHHVFARLDGLGQIVDLRSADLARRAMDAFKQNAIAVGRPEVQVTVWDDPGHRFRGRRDMHVAKDDASERRYGEEGDAAHHDRTPSLLS